MGRAPLDTDRVRWHCYFPPGESIRRGLCKVPVRPEGPVLPLAERRWVRAGTRVAFPLVRRRRRAVGPGSLTVHLLTVGRLG